MSWTPPSRYWGWGWGWGASYGCGWPTQPRGLSGSLGPSCRMAPSSWTAPCVCPARLPARATYLPGLSASKHSPQHCPHPQPSISISAREVQSIYCIGVGRAWLLLQPRPHTPKWDAYYCYIHQKTRLMTNQRPPTTPALGQPHATCTHKGRGTNSPHSQHQRLEEHSARRQRGFERQCPAR